MKTRQRLQQESAQLLQQLARALHAFELDCDSDALHDMRIALRALRSLCGVILKTRSRRDQARLLQLKRLAQLSNRARDLEVCITLLSSAPICQTLQAQLVIEYQKLRTVLQSEPIDIKRLQAHINHRLATRAHWAKKLAAFEQRLAQGLQQRISQFQSPATLEAELIAWHRLRIQVKRLRYLHEYALTSRTNSPLRALKLAQQVLGELHDAQLLSQYQTVDFSPLLAQARVELDRLKHCQL